MTKQNKACLSKPAGFFILNVIRMAFIQGKKIIFTLKKAKRGNLRITNFERLKFFIVYIIFFFDMIKKY